LENPIAFWKKEQYHGRMKIAKLQSQNTKKSHNCLKIINLQSDHILVKNTKLNPDMSKSQKSKLDC
jgi:hypothetical protein